MRKNNLITFHHFGVEVSDIDLSMDFYVNTLGFNVLEEKKYSEEFNETYVMIDLGGTVLELISSHNKNIDFSKVSTRFHLAFETKDFDILLERVNKENIPLAKKPVVIEGDVKLMTLLDPDNNMIDIGQLI